MDVTKNGEGVVLCATLVEREIEWGLNELKVTSTSNFFILIGLLVTFVILFVFLDLKESYCL